MIRLSIGEGSTTCTFLVVVMAGGDDASHCVYSGGFSPFRCA